MSKYTFLVTLTLKYNFEQKRLLEICDLDGFVEPGFWASSLFSKI